MFDFGFWELALAGLVALIVVGPKRLPGFAAQAGRYAAKVRRMAREFRQQLEDETDWDKVSETIEDQKREIGRLHTDFGRVVTPAPDETTKTPTSSNPVDEAIKAGRYQPDPDMFSDEDESVKSRDAEKPGRD